MEPYTKKFGRTSGPKKKDFCFEKKDINNELAIPLSTVLSEITMANDLLDIFHRDYSKLVTVTSTCLYSLTEKLYSRNLISEDVHDQLITGQESSNVKSSILMANVKKSLKIDSGKVRTFYDALKEERMFDHLTKEMAIVGSSDAISGTCSSALSDDLNRDLNAQLRKNLTQIMSKYSLFVDGIRTALNDKGVSAGELRSFLLTQSVFNYDDKNFRLFQDRKEDLVKAGDVNDIFDVVVEYCSFLNYELFLTIAKKYGVCKGQEEMNYPEHLKDYINKHKVNEFISINPSLRSYSASSKLMTLKLNIEQTAKLARMKDIVDAIADIMKLNPSAVQILGIEKGCVALSLLIPTSLANIVFPAGNRTKWTDAQMEKFARLNITSLKCNGHTYLFAAESPEIQVTSKPTWKRPAQKDAGSDSGYNTGSCDAKRESARPKSIVYASVNSCRADLLNYLRLNDIYSQLISLKIIPAGYHHATFESGSPRALKRFVSLLQRCSKQQFKDFVHTLKKSSKEGDDHYYLAKQLEESFEKFKEEIYPDVFKMSDLQKRDEQLEQFEEQDHDTQLSNQDEELEHLEEQEWGDQDALLQTQGEDLELSEQGERRYYQDEQRQRYRCTACSKRSITAVCLITCTVVCLIVGPTIFLYIFPILASSQMSPSTILSHNILPVDFGGNDQLDISRLDMTIENCCNAEAFIISSKQCSAFRSLKQFIFEEWQEDCPMYFSEDSDLYIQTSRLNLTFLVLKSLAAFQDYQSLYRILVNDSNHSNSITAKVIDLLCQESGSYSSQLLANETYWCFSEEAVTFYVNEPDFYTVIAQDTLRIVGTIHYYNLSVITSMGAETFITENGSFSLLLSDSVFNQKYFCIFVLCNENCDGDDCGIHSVSFSLHRSYGSLIFFYITFFASLPCLVVLLCSLCCCFCYIRRQTTYIL